MDLSIKAPTTAPAPESVSAVTAHVDTQDLLQRWERAHADAKRMKVFLFGDDCPAAVGPERSQRIHDRIANHQGIWRALMAAEEYEDELAEELDDIDPKTLPDAMILLRYYVLSDRYDDIADCSVCFDGFIQGLCKLLGDMTGIANPFDE